MFITAQAGAFGDSCVAQTGLEVTPGEREVSPHPRCPPATLLSRQQRGRGSQGAAQVTAEGGVHGLSEQLKSEITGFLTVTPERREASSTLHPVPGARS